MRISKLRVKNEVFRCSKGTTPKTYRTHLDELPSSVDECDVWLINGSPNSVYYDLAWIKNLISFVQQLHTAKKPLVGICFGHQIIATALGGKVEKSPQGWGVGMAHLLHL